MPSSNLPVYEIIVYGFVWVAAICYSSYNVYLAGKLFDHTAIGDDFSDNWHGYKKDMADYEWTTWLPFLLYTMPPWVAAHIALTQVTRWISPQGVPGAQSLITLLFIMAHFGPACALFVITQVVVYYLILRLKSVALVWLFGVPFLLVSCFGLQETWEHTGKSDHQFTMMLVSTTWLNLHCISFSLETLASAPSKTSGTRMFYDLLGYSLYFPTYFLGPFIIYTNFGPYMYRSFERWTVERVSTFVLSLLRYLLWAAVTEASLYFLYIHALQYHMTIVASLGDWTLYGLGYLMGQFFCLKYVVVYGLCGSVANFDGYIAPPPPKCVARIHLYTDMWRYFDVGFYLFIHKYIYTPLCGGQKKVLRRLMASAMCFGFVFLWHGVHLSIFIWSVLNFLGVSLVSFSISLSNTPTFKNWQKRNLSEANYRRLTALVSAPVFILGPASSFYFFSGINTGNTFVIHLFFIGSWTGMVALLFVSYCMCQVSIEIKQWEKINNQKLKSH
uniref:Protein-cysteine N-palmitoyltransferase Rasp n=1 Tax=Homalodisca liturata TaxID=320908 RepID=A0A1B6IR26_9HEMI